MSHGIKVAPPAPRKPVLAIGQIVDKYVDGLSITLQRVTATVWTVTVYWGNLRIEDQCGSYDDEVAAALVASGYLQLALAEQTPAKAETSPYAPLPAGQSRIHRGSDGTTVVLDNTSPVGPRVMVSRDGQTIRNLCTIHATETAAIWRYAGLVTAHPAA